MAKENYSHISFVLDRSGSMQSVLTDTIGGFNAFLKTQKEASGTATFSLVQFDDSIDLVHSFVDINAVPELTTKTFVPRGMTALYDAIGLTINSVGSQLAKMDEEDRPDKVIFVILTDGNENSSKEYSNNTIHSMIKHQTDVYSWAFMFLGANINAEKVGATLGVDTDFSATFGATSVGVNTTFDILGTKLRCMRSEVGALYCKGEKTSIAMSAAYTSADRNAMMQK